MHKVTLKQQAVELRTQGLSYSEILEQISIAKSTLSLWLQEVGLSKKQRQRLTEKRRLSALRGAQRRKNDRLLRTAQIHAEALGELDSLTQKELWLLGIALYWAEGSKEKEGSAGTGISFSNSDSRMIALFIRWLMEACEINASRINFQIYIHENSLHRVPDVQKYWSEATGFPMKSFDKVYFKKNKLSTNRKNVGSLYYGLLRVKVSASSNLNRKVAGWVNAIFTRCQII